MSLGKTLILGDSYSTFEGYIPEGYDTWFGTERLAMGEIDVSKVEQTWWYPIFDGKENVLLRNESYSGTTVCNNVRPEHSIDASFINRFDKLVKDGFFEKTKVDTVLVFGGTNDSFTDCVIGEVQYDGFTSEDLMRVLPAFGYLAKRIAEAVPGARVCWLINTDLKEEIVEGTIQTATHFGQEYIRFSYIDKTTGHPNIKGMKEISDVVKAHFA